MKKAFLAYVTLGLVFCTASCVTPQSKKLRFEADWIRSALKTENYGYRHSERTAPLIDGDVIYQGNGVDGLVAFSKENGRVKWRFDVKNGVESGFASDERFLYFGASDGQFYALNKLTGKIAWSFPTRSENLGAPTLNQGVVYFISGNNILYALDSKTGKQIWNYNRGEVSSLSIRGASKPAIYKNSLYAGFSDGYLAAINTADGSLIWERKLSNNLKFVDVDASPVIEENLIWASSYDGSLYCLSRTDGQIQWRLDEGGSVPVTLSGDILYFSTLLSNVYALNKTTGAVIWKYASEEKYGIPTQPLLNRGVVIFGLSDSDVIGISQTSGKYLARYTPGTGVSATPVLETSNGENNSFIYIFSNQANLHKLNMNWFDPRRENLNLRVLKGNL